MSSYVNINSPGFTMCYTSVICKQQPRFAVLVLKLTVWVLLSTYININSLDRFHCPHMSIPTVRFHCPHVNISGPASIVLLHTLQQFGFHRPHAVISTDPVSSSSYININSPGFIVFGHKLQQLISVSSYGNVNTPGFIVLKC